MLLLPGSVPEHPDRSGLLPVGRDGAANGRLLLAGAGKRQPEVPHLQLLVARLARRPQVLLLELTAAGPGELDLVAVVDVVLVPAREHDGVGPVRRPVDASDRRAVEPERRQLEQKKKKETHQNIKQYLPSKTGQKT